MERKLDIKVKERAELKGSSREALEKERDTERGF
jgi:hypothetical protein